MIYRGMMTDTKQSAGFFWCMKTARGAHRMVLFPVYTLNGYPLLNHGSEEHITNIDYEKICMFFNAACPSKS